jgi:hypothetical protein
MVDHEPAAAKARSRTRLAIQAVLSLHVSAVALASVRQSSCRAVVRKGLPASPLPMITYWRGL